MSNIFYSNVDINLRQELNARGQSGISRSTKDLDFMLGKIANVLLQAYDENSPDRVIIGELGGNGIYSGRYLPTGPNGFLNDNKTYGYSIVELDEKTGRAKDVFNIKPDSSRKIGPFITSTDVTIGDHSMGLLNKATVNITIPNPERDLDSIEDIWLRPGRYVSIIIAHPESAIITSELLTSGSLPNRAKLEELYPQLRETVKYNEFSKQVRKMNQFTFEGLVTSFDFSYQSSGQVDVTISLTGTSQAYPDISLYIPGSKQEDPPKPTKTAAVTIDPQIKTQKNKQPELPGTSSFYEVLYKQVDTAIKNVNSGNSTPYRTGCVRYTSSSPKVQPTDQYIVYGERYSPKGLELLAEARPLLKGDPLPNTNFSRYITLGALMQFINDYCILNSTGSLPAANIICSDQYCRSNCYEYTTSCNPDEILFLPKETLIGSESSMHIYGITTDTPTIVDDELGIELPAIQTPDLIYYMYLQKHATQFKDTPENQWPGIDSYVDSLSTRIIYPSRILINMKLIQEILLGVEDKNSKRTGGLTQGGSVGFSLKAFLSVISSYINYASGGLISLKLVSDPRDPDILYFKDTKYLRDEVKSTDGTTETVTAYSVPMFANHPYGTIVRDFKLSAKLPENVKALSYTLNEDPSKLSEQDIAPYMNFMYNAKNAAAVNRLLDEYSNRHKQAIQKLIDSKKLFGGNPTLDERKSDLYKKLTSYYMFPTNDIRKTQQITAPIFPFDAEFTIDGIHGFKYGDVLTFDALPSKYRINTVFSVISITHTVTSEGTWTTTVRCIMRPNIP